MMNSRSGPSWLTFVQFAVSILAVGVCWITAVGFAAIMAFGGSDQTSIDGLSFSWLPQSISAVLLSLLFIPSAVTSFRTMLGKQPIVPRLSVVRSAALGVLILCWPLVIWLGQNFSADGSTSAVLLPFLSLLTTGIPILAWTEIGRWRLARTSAQRDWGLFNSGLIGGPVFAMPVELGLFVLAAVGISLWYSSNPEAAQMLEQLGKRLMLSQGTPESIMRILRPLITNPTCIFAVFAGLSGLIPLIEESIKPLGLWLLCRRELTPAEGFTGGLLCGAGFAFYESLSISSSFTGESWASIVVVRAGTSLLHVTTTGLVGWGLASAWKERRFLRFGAAFFAAMCLHGLWNALAIGQGVARLLGSETATAGSTGSILALTPWGMGAMVAVFLAVLVALNAHLRKQGAVLTQPEIITEDRGEMII